MLRNVLLLGVEEQSGGHCHSGPAPHHWERNCLWLKLQGPCFAKQSLSLWLHACSPGVPADHEALHNMPKRLLAFLEQSELHREKP